MKISAFAILEEMVLLHYNQIQCHVVITCTVNSDLQYIQQGVIFFHASNAQYVYKCMVSHGTMPLK